MAVAIVNFDIDRFRHESADMLALAMLCIDCRLCIIVVIIKLNSYDSAFDILNSKGLVNSNRKPDSHAQVEEHHRRKPLGLLSAR